MLGKGKEIFLIKYHNRFVHPYVRSIITKFTDTTVVFLSLPPHPHHPNPHLSLKDPSGGARGCVAGDVGVGLANVSFPEVPAPQELPANGIRVG
ncbi:hypothetical protein C0Q70_13737 [Pomacea canaliculata]|uniref:Uncharacterized protein n=1 Tax=Pomacea canaliculata TaxID=400727 RepID=A0A2T7NY28_POMCA|nr:hypothetical protein C0Q70_13737 [Pomacea canaliculata]